MDSLQEGRLHKGGFDVPFNKTVPFRREPSLQSIRHTSLFDRRPAPLSFSLCHHYLPFSGPASEISGPVRAMRSEGAAGLNS